MVCPPPYLTSQFFTLDALAVLKSTDDLWRWRWLRPQLTPDWRKGVGVRHTHEKAVMWAQAEAPVDGQREQQAGSQSRRSEGLVAMGTKEKQCSRQGGCRKTVTGRCGQLRAVQKSAALQPALKPRPGV